MSSVPEFQQDSCLPVVAEMYAATVKSGFALTFAVASSLTAENPYFKIS